MDEQPWIDDWPMFEEAHSKFPVLADIESARVRLARKWNSRRLPREIEIAIAVERALESKDRWRSYCTDLLVLHTLQAEHKRHPGIATTFAADCVYWEDRRA